MNKVDLVAAPDATEHYYFFNGCLGNTEAASGGCTLPTDAYPRENKTVETLGTRNVFRTLPLLSFLGEGGRGRKNSLKYNGRAAFGLRKFEVSRRWDIPFPIEIDLDASGIRILEVGTE